VKTVCDKVVEHSLT